MVVDAPEVPAHKPPVHRMGETELKFWGILDYGFNEPEEGFVWSTFSFGMRFKPNARRAIISAYYQYESGTLRIHNKRTGSRSYQLRSGINRLIVVYGQNDTLCDLAISPRRVCPGDVRELGLMIQSVEGILDSDDQNIPDADEGAVDSWSPPARIQASRILGQHLLESFIGLGYSNSCIRTQNGCTHFELALFLPPSERISESLTIPISVNGDISPVEIRQFDDTSGVALSRLPMAYRCVIDLDHLVSDGNLAPVDIFIVGDDGKERFPFQSLHWRGYGVGGLPTPDHIFRVTGPASLEYFLLSGATWYVKLVKLYQNLTGRHIDTCERILDWGVGCARIARFFPEHLRGRIHGVDIDAFNVDWCNENIPNIICETTSTNPPLPFPDSSFELIYGHSVLTHLGETDQHAWLRELARVTKPGGYCLVTILGEVSWFTRFYPVGRTPDNIAQFMETGFVDDGALDVGVDFSAPGTYRNISHTVTYIRRVWSEYFEIVRIIQNFADLQNLVVLRKKSI